MEKECLQCKIVFTPRSHGGTKQFCSYSCSNTYKWKTRPRKPPKTGNKKCSFCEKDYPRNINYSDVQWKASKFCSVYCTGLARAINDDYKNRGERFRRKRGSLKQHTPEWLERIRTTTRDAMLKPEINFKLRQKRSPMSMAAKISRSNSLAGRLPKNMMFGSNNHDHIQRGDYENSKGTMYFRSKWEANYALYLDFLVERGEIKSWEYEADVFMFEQVKLGTRSYRPDFKILNNDGSFEYHEIKGYMDSKSKTKLRRMSKYYPEVKLILIDSPFYRSLVKQVGKMLKFY